MMTPHKLSDKYFVSPQIKRADIKALAEAGFRKIICNRPDEEISSEIHSNVMADAAKDTGIGFDFLPFTALTINSEIVAKQGKLIENARGPVIAYCGSGTRCALVWAFLQAGIMPMDDILKATASAGYNFEALRNVLT